MSSHRFVMHHRLIAEGSSAGMHDAETRLRSILSLARRSSIASRG